MTSDSLRDLAWTALLPIRLLKAGIWWLRIQRWKILLDEQQWLSRTVYESPFKVIPTERAARLVWKIEGAEKKLAAYLCKHRIGTVDLSGG